MREHQIVLNLKREQFEEIQRLARLAGSKSVSAYLKDRVLSMIKLDQTEVPETHMFSPAAHEMHGINHELSRMHRELQVFIAESLSNSIYAGDNELEGEADLYDETYLAYQQMARNMENDLVQMRAQQASDTVNSAPMDPYAILDIPQLKPDNQSFARQSQAPLPAQSDTPFNPQQGSPVSLPDAVDASGFGGHPVNNYVESAGIYTNVAAESIWLTPPNQIINPELQSGGASGGTSGNTGETRNEYGQPNDELEDLAERAFAISPRLGAVDSTPPAGAAGFRKRQVEDPLEDLIDGSIMEQAERLRQSNIEEAMTYEDGVVYAFGGPETAELEPESDSLDSDPELLVAPTDAEMEFSAETDESATDADSTGSEKTATQLRAEQSETINQSTEVLTDNISDDVATDPNNDPSNAPVNAEEDQDIAPSYAPSPDPSALGGPPPKRKRSIESAADDDDGGVSGGPPPKRRKK